MKILHFADAHIDMANYGRHDPETGLPLRVLDFLKSLDTIIDAAVSEQVDMVIFAGDAYDYHKQKFQPCCWWGTMIFLLLWVALMPSRSLIRYRFPLLECYTDLNSLDL
jgi:hypothetical protein